MESNERRKIVFLTVGCINYDCDVNFYEPLKALYGDVTNYNFIERMDVLGREGMNAEIIQVVQKESPDYVFYHVSYRGQITFDCLDELKRMGAKVVAWGSDDHWRFDEHSRFLAEHVYCSVTTDRNAVGKFQALGLNVIRSQWAANHVRYRKIACGLTRAVTFVGNRYGRRQQNLLHLQECGVPVEVFGKSFGRYVTFDQMIALLNTSRINLSFAGSSCNDDLKQIKGRVFEVPMCGGFLLTEYADGIEEYFDIGKEIECFYTMEEAVEKIQFYLRHERLRKAIAEHGHQRALRDHTWVQRLRAVFDELDRMRAGPRQAQFGKPVTMYDTIEPSCPSHSVLTPDRSRVTLTVSAAPIHPALSTNRQDAEYREDSTSKPRVSVLMAVHNGQRYVREALESIYRQTYQDFEVIIVDDGSTDGTGEILMDMKDSRTFIHRNAENLGLTKSLNIGLQHCRGDYVARMDADDISHRERLAKQVRLLDENSDCLVVGCWCRWLDAQGQVAGTWEPKTQTDEIAARLLVGNCIAHGSAVIRRAALVEAGGYDERYRCAQDYELWLRLSESGEVRNIAAHLYDLRDWKEAISTSKKSLQRRYARVALLDACRRRSEPYVSIVIVHRNMREFTTRCMDKVFELSDVPFEVLVTGSSSAEESLGSLWPEHRIRWVSLPEGVGEGLALDRAVQHVRSKYVVVLDSRAHPTRPGWLNALIEPLDDEVLVSGIHYHRDYVHPACLAMETDTFWNYDLSFQPSRPGGDENEELGTIHWDVAEGISLKIRRLGYKLHYLERSDVPSADPVGCEYGGVVYYQRRDAPVATKPPQTALETAAGETIQKTQEKQLVGEPVESRGQGDITWGSVVRAREATGRRRVRPRAAVSPAASQGLSLSVVLTTYNRPELLEKVLAGFARQTAPRDEFEVVVVDDGTIPPVQAITDRFTGAINLKYRHQDNSGLAAARNAGILAAEGDVLLFSDDDDVPYPELVAEHLRSHREHPDETVAVLGHLDWHPDLQVTPLMHYVTHVGGEYFGFDRLEYGRFYDQWKWWGGLVSAKRSLLDDVEGPFDPRLRFGYEDTELMCRLMPRQIRILYNAKARSAILRPITFEDFCRRSTRQGRALHRVAAAHPDIIIPRYQLDHARVEYHNRYAVSLEEWTGKVARFDALATARMNASGSMAPEHLQSLYTGYRECFRGHLLKGYVEELEAVEGGRVHISDPVNGRESLPATSQMTAGRRIASECPTRTKAVDVDGRTGKEPLRITVVNSSTPGYDMGSSNLRIYHLLKILTAAGHDIDHLYQMRCPDDARYKAAFDGAITFIKTAGTVTNFQDYLHFNGVDRLDCVWITNLWVTNYMEYALELARWLRRHRPETRIVVDTMDFHYKKYARRFELSRDEKDRAKARLFLGLEQQLYPLADTVLVVTEVERQNILENVGPDCRVEVIPNIHTVLTDTPLPAQRNHLCFLGAFRVNHNADAVRWFRDEVFPLIVKAAPDVEFHILGHGNEKQKDAIKPHPNVKVIGYVPDAERALAGYRVFVCPMIYGAGMKGKIGVAAGAGTPVVTTTVGAEGFGLVDGRHCFITDDPREFADTCLRLLRDDGLWHDLSAHIRDLVREQFSPESVGPRVQDVLDTVMSAPRSERPAAGTPQDAARPVRTTRGQTVEPKVSVITACHNGEAFLPECLESICRQTFGQWELFLLDDGSTDGTRRVIEEYARRDSRIRAYYFDESQGPYVRRKFAIAQANSPFVVIQDSDDVMGPSKLDILCREIATDDRLAMVGSFYRTFLEERRGLEYTECNDLPLEHDGIIERFVSWRHGMSHGSAIIRKSLFDEIGPYDENPFASDSFWSAKLAAYIRQGAPWRVRNVPEYLTLIRVHATNQTQQLPTFDPRSRRTRYHQYCECKLRRIRDQLQQSTGRDVGQALRQCDCSDFLVRFKTHIIKWEGEPLDDHVIPQLLENSVWLFNHGFYVSCVSMLSGIEVMQRDLPKRMLNVDLLRAMALYGLDFRDPCLTYLHREIDNHDSPAAKALLQDYFERGLRIDVQRWCAERADRFDLQIVPAEQTRSHPTAAQKKRAYPLGTEILER